MKLGFLDLDPPLNIRYKNIEDDYNNKLAGVKVNPFSGKIFKKLNAERDIKPETEKQDNVGGLNVYEDGNGATNIIQLFVNNVNLPSDLIEEKLLDELNKIIEPDSSFNRIVVQRLHSVSLWEIFLEEEQKGRIALSKSGSGLKTILLVLIFILLIPHKENKEL